MAFNRVVMAIALHGRQCHVLVEKGRSMIQGIGDQSLNHTVGNNSLS
jgi:hypothetical protein